MLQTGGQFLDGRYGARFNAFVLGLLLSSVAACVDRDEPVPGPSGPLLLRPVPESRVLGLGESATLLFVLKDAREVPGSGQLIRFRIAGEGDNPSKGATLNVSEAVTNTTGSVSLALQAGVAANFFVEATTPRADPVRLPITVQAATLADVIVVPIIDPNAPRLSALTLSLHDGQRCAALKLEPPFVLPVPVRPIQSLSAQTAAHTFTALRTDESHAAVAIGRRQDGVARAIGCVDISGKQLSAATAVRVYLPLTAFYPMATGNYALSSEWEFAPLPDAVTEIAEAWREQARCPLAPSDLWLDCTIDALSNSVDDPLDCRPGIDEGAIGLALQARRGTADVSSGCAGRRDKNEQPSLEALVFDTLQSNPIAKALVAKLPALSDKVEHMFDRVRFTSLMEINADGPQDSVARTHHRLVSAEVAVGADLERVILNSLGLPALESRQIPTIRTADRVTFNAHAFSVELGSILRYAFVSRALRQANVADSIDNLTMRIAEGLQLQSTKGCEALDRLLCGELVKAPGCLQDACARGLQAWTATLSDGFLALDGEGADLTMNGSAKTDDTNADFIVDRLGSLIAGGLPPGLWDGLLRTRSGNHVLNGLWVGTPAPE